MNSKRGLSEIISSVLLILVVIVAIGLISYFLVPMIKNNLSGSQSCLDLNEYFKVVGNSCYTLGVAAVVDNPDTPVDETKAAIPESSTLIVERGMTNLEVSGFSVSIADSNGESTNYQVKAGTVAGVSMAVGGSTTIVLPNAGESKKYLFDKAGSKISIAALQKSGKICSPSEFTIETC